MKVSLVRSNEKRNRVDLKEKTLCVIMSLKNFPSLAYKPVDNFYIFSTRHVFESYNVPYFVTKTIGFVFNVDRL